MQAAGRIEAGEAHLALKNYAAAANDYNAALRLMRGREGAGLLADRRRQLEGEALLRTGQMDKGRATLDQAAREVAARPGPDAWIQATFALEAMAQTARDVGDWDLAERLARQMVQHDLNYAGSGEALRRARAHERE